MLQKRLAKEAKEKEKLEKLAAKVSINVKPQGRRYSRDNAFSSLKYDAASALRTHAFAL